jgi:hypothetical protein
MKKYNEIIQYKEPVDMLVKSDKTIREYLKKESYTLQELKDVASVKYELFQSKRSCWLMQKILVKISEQN